MAESIWSDGAQLQKPNSKPNPGSGPDRLPLVGPEPRQKNAPGGTRPFSSSADEFRPAIPRFGLVATRARLRFAGTHRLPCTSRVPPQNRNFLLCWEAELSTLP